MLILYDYFRSSTCYRLRIALNVKGIPYQKKQIHLINNGGEQHATDYQTLNPLQRVPTLIDDDKVLTQSLAILEYLEEKHPKPALLFGNPVQRAHIRAVAQLIACDMHPLNNLSTLQYLQKNFSIDEHAKQKWYHHWLNTGFQAIEKLISEQHNTFCFGDQFSLADVCLVPQIYNARRFNFDMTPFSILEKIYDNCLQLPAVQQASPEQQTQEADNG